MKYLIPIYSNPASRALWEGFSDATAGADAPLAGRRPRHPVGWLLLGVGLGLAVNILVQPYVKDGAAASARIAPVCPLPGGAHLRDTVVWLSCAGFVLLLTPTGSLPSPRWRWWARVAAAAPVVTLPGLVVQPDPPAPDYHGNPLAVPALAGLLVVPGVAGIVVVLVGLLVGAGALVGRFRRAPGSSACSFAGWRWRRPWRRCCCWSPSSPGTWGRTPWCWRPWRCAWRCCRWPPGRRSCATGCTTGTASAARWPAAGRRLRRRGPAGRSTWTR